MDNVDSIAMLGQEPAEPPLHLEEAAEECDHAQAYSDCEGGVPECIYGRLPVPITQWVGQCRGKLEGKQMAAKCERE